jgi:hypothetical protein
VTARTYTVDSQWLTGAARAYTWVAIRYTRIVWLLAALLVVSVVLDLVRHVIGYSIPAVLFAIALPLLILFNSRRIIRRQLPIGSSVQVEFGETTLNVTTPLTKSEMSYDLFTRAVRIGGFALLRQTSSGWVIMDGSVASDEDLARIAPPAVVSAG